MWGFPGKRHGGGGAGPLEGRTVEVGKHSVSVRQTLAQGGCAFVYLAKCSQTSRSYALKHIVCGTDKDMQESTKKEVAIMAAMKGHPNIVSLVSHSVLEGPACLSAGGGLAPAPGAGGVSKCVEFVLLMEFCEKTLVSAMDARGGVWYDEKTLLLLFRDICNGLYALHGQTPPIAHRDMKAENVLQGKDGSWKLCDFGSATTRHGRIERIEDMGVEEDVIRKTTTPAYRSPEMWDLYQKEVLSEKVDIWALGCLLYRMAFFKSCFDGESKLQVLNGRYSIPENHKFSAPVITLIRDMLAPTPDARPTALEVWQRVNRLLPAACRLSSGPDRAPKSYKPPASERPLGSGMPKPQNGTSGRAASQAGAGRGSSSERAGAGGGGGGGSSMGAGAFWAAFDDEPLASTASVAATQSAHTLGGAGILREDARAAGGVPGGLAGTQPRASAPSAAAGAAEGGQGSVRRNTTASEQRVGTGRGDPEGTPSRGGASPGVPGQDAGAGGAGGGYSCSWSQSGSRQGETGTKGGASASAGGDGAGASGPGSDGKERGGPEAGGARAGGGGGTRADELKGQIERLQGQLKRMVSEREGLKASNTRLGALVEAQAAEIADLKARLEAAGGAPAAHRPSGGGDPWGTPGATTPGRRFTESDASEFGGAPRGGGMGSGGGLDGFGSLDAPFRGSQGAVGGSGASDPFHSLASGLGSTEPLGTENGLAAQPKVQPNGWQTFVAPQTSSNQPAGWAAF